MLRKLSIVFVLLALLGVFTDACELNEMGSGCRIHEAQCHCGFGCKSEFRYDNMEACKMAFNRNRDDPCRLVETCLHGALCMQISQEPGFQCRCDGTGYYGARCEKLCPTRDDMRSAGHFPHECIVI